MAGVEFRDPDSVVATRACSTDGCAIFGGIDATDDIDTIGGVVGVQARNVLNAIVHNGNWPPNVETETNVQHRTILERADDLGGLIEVVGKKRTGQICALDQAPTLLPIPNSALASGGHGAIFCALVDVLDSGELLNGYALERALGAGDQFDSSVVNVALVLAGGWGSEGSQGGGSKDDKSGSVHFEK